ncbi:MAG: hypothetical protein ACI39Q_09360 [Wujia sp.]
MKKKILYAIFVICIVFIAGCGTKEMLIHMWGAVISMITIQMLLCFVRRMLLNEGEACFCCK